MDPQPQARTTGVDKVINQGGRRLIAAMDQLALRCQRHQVWSWTQSGLARGSAARRRRVS